MFCVKCCLIILHLSQFCSQLSVGRSGGQEVMISDEAREMIKMQEATSPNSVVKWDCFFPRWSFLEDPALVCDQIQMVRINPSWVAALWEYPHVRLTPAQADMAFPLCSPCFAALCHSGFSEIHRCCNYAAQGYQGLQLSYTGTWGLGQFYHFSRNEKLDMLELTKFQGCSSIFLHSSCSNRPFGNPLLRRGK